MNADGVVGTVDASDILKIRVALIDHFIADTDMNNFGPDVSSALNTKPSAKTSRTRAPQVSRQISLNTISDLVGANISVPVLIDNGADVVGYFLNFSFPSTLATYTGFTRGDLTETWGDPTLNDSTPGQLIIAGAGTASLSGSGSLIDLNFTLARPGHRRYVNRHLLS